MRRTAAVAAHLSSTANSFINNHPRCSEASPVTLHACQKSYFSSFETVFLDMDKTNEPTASGLIKTTADS